MRKRSKFDGNNQIAIAFPPIVSPESVKTWRTFKNVYPGHIILLVQDRLYITTGIDALIVSGTAGLPLYRTEIITCFFHAAQLAGVLELLTKAEVRVAICDPVDRPDQHIFT